MSNSPEITEKIIEQVTGHPDRFAQIRLRFRNGREKTFVLNGDTPDLLQKLRELADRGTVVSQAAGHEE